MRPVNRKATSRNRNGPSERVLETNEKFVPKDKDVVSIELRDTVLGVSVMTLCPIAMAASCKKCPAFNFCPLKNVIGDYKQEEEASTPQRSAEGESKPKQN